MGESCTLSAPERYIHDAGLRTLIAHLYRSLAKLIQNSTKLVVSSEMLEQGTASHLLSIVRATTALPAILSISDGFLLSFSLSKSIKYIFCLDTLKFIIRMHKSLLIFFEANKVCHILHPCPPCSLRSHFLFFLSI